MDALPPSLNELGPATQLTSPFFFSAAPDSGSTDKASLRIGANVALRDLQFSQVGLLGWPGKRENPLGWVTSTQQATLANQQALRAALRTHKSGGSLWNRLEILQVLWELGIRLDFDTTV